MENGDLRANVQELLVEVAVLKSRLETSKGALEMQAQEYARRLGELNNAHDRAEKLTRTYLTRELYDRDKMILDDWRREVDIDRAKIVGKTSTYSAVVAIVISLASLVGVFWNVITLHQ